MIFTNKKEFLKKCPIGRLAALDVGTKTIGIAITDDSRTISSPVETISRKGNKKDFPILLEILKSRNTKGIIIGLPLSFTEAETESSLFIKRFADNLSLQTELPIIFQDERLTSFEAEDLMLNKIGSTATKKIVDKIAASYILESFL